MLRQLLNVAYADLASRAEDTAKLDEELESEPTRGPRRRPRSRNVDQLMAAVGLQPPPRRLHVVEGGEGP